VDSYLASAGNGGGLVGHARCYVFPARELFEFGRPIMERLARDPGVQGLLLGSDDGDEFWSAAGHVAAVRPDGHRPQLIEHHAKLLTAIVGALTSGY